jgi:hypothetical protein
MLDAQVEIPLWKVTSVERETVRPVSCKVCPLFFFFFSVWKKAIRCAKDTDRASSVQGQMLPKKQRT